MPQQEQSDTGKDCIGDRSVVQAAKPTRTAPPVTANFASISSPDIARNLYHRNCGRSHLGTSSHTDVRRITAFIPSEDEHGCQQLVGRTGANKD
jgi:hypothetical protein